MFLVAFTLIGVLTIALMTAVALIALDVAAEQRHRAHRPAPTPAKRLHLTR